MPSRDFGVPIETLRRAAAERIEATSLRLAAAEVGMSFRGLEGFVKGAYPHPSTAKKLTNWYLIRRAADEDFEPDSELAAAALKVLVRHLPTANQAEAVEAIADVIREKTKQAGVPDPGWC